jgi:hypothetical protein
MTYQEELEKYEQLVQKTTEDNAKLLRDPIFCQSRGLPPNLSEVAIKALSHCMALDRLARRRPRPPIE